MALSQPSRAEQMEMDRKSAAFRAGSGTIQGASLPTAMRGGGLFDNIGLQGQFSPQMMAPAIAQSRAQQPQQPQQERGFWDRFGDYLGGADGDSPLTGLADFGDIMDRRNMQPVQSIPHPVPPGRPIENQGLFGLRELVASSNRGGWGR